MSTELISEIEFFKTQIYQILNIGETSTLDILNIIHK